MDKEKFIKKAKEYGYTDEEIKREIDDYERHLKEGIDIDPIIFLIDNRDTIETTFYLPEPILKKIKNAKN